MSNTCAANDMEMGLVSIEAVAVASAQKQVEVTLALGSLMIGLLLNHIKNKT